MIRIREAQGLPGKEGVLRSKPNLTALTGHSGFKLESEEVNFDWLVYLEQQVMCQEKQKDKFPLSICNVCILIHQVAIATLLFV